MVFKSKFPDVVPDEKYKDLVSNFFWSQLDKFRANVLFVDYETRRQWTGARIKETSAMLARQLVKHGLEPEDDCVMFHKHCDYSQLTALGVLFAGGSICAGYDLDPEHEHGYMLEVMLPTFVFVTHKLAEEMLRLRQADQRHKYTIVLMDDDSLEDHEFKALLSVLQSGSGANPSGGKEPPVVLGLHRDLLIESAGADAPLPVQVDPHRPAFILLTSGSTGQPKPAVRSQRNSLYVCHSFMGAEELWDLNETSVMAAHLPLDHGTGIFNLKQCLTRGYKSIIIDGYTPETMLHAIETYRITDLVLGSALVHNLLSSLEVDGGDLVGPTNSERAAGLRKQLGSLRNLIAVGSSIASQSVVSKFMSCLPDCSVRQAFGLTEGGFLCVMPRELSLRNHDLLTEAVGYPLPNVELKLVGRRQSDGDGGDSQAEEITEPDQPGELYVRAPTVSPGYLGERFRKQARDSFLPDGFYKSSDMCAFGSDGMLRVYGRLNDVLCLGDGWKVLPNEIERVIMEHPLVEEAAVVGIPDPALPTCHMPRAYVVARAGVDVDQDDDSDGTPVVPSNNNNNDTSQNGGQVRHGGSRKSVSQRQVYDFVAERLSSVKRLTGGVKFVKELPKISIGKVDKRALKSADGY